MPQHTAPCQQAIITPWGLETRMSILEIADSNPAPTSEPMTLPAGAIDKVATALDSIRLELQGIRSALEALVAKP